MANNKQIAMGKLLIIAASVLQLPAIRRAKELGHYVAVADYNPQAVGISYTDEYFNASTIDEDAICAVAREFQPNGIMTLATDMPMRAIAKAITLLGLPGISYETAIKATDKYRMIEAFKEHNVSAPWYYHVKSIDELKKIASCIEYPCIIKPTDNAGSRGVCLVHNADDMLQSYDYTQSQSRGGNVIVEEYLQGQEVSVEVMVLDGEVNILAITDKLTTGAPHFVEMGHSQPTSLDENTQTKIRQLAIQAVKAVGINCGPAHVEMMVTKRGPVMIELGARMGGDCITTHLVPLSTGIDMIQATIDVSFGLKPDLTPTLSCGSAIRFFDVPKGIIQSIEGIEQAYEIDGVKEITFTKQVGDAITDVHSSIDRAGYIIAQSTNAVAAVAVCEEVIKHITIKTV